MNDYDRLECELIAVFRSDSITDKSIYRRGKIISPYKSKQKEFIWAVNEVIIQHKSEKKEEAIQLKLIA